MEVGMCTNKNDGGQPVEMAASYGGRNRDFALHFGRLGGIMYG
jgi:hypothetical protein